MNINNLRQLISLRIFSILGYTVPLAIGLDILFSKSLLNVLFTIFLGNMIFIINPLLLIIAPIEYHVRKSKFKENAFTTKPYFFIIGIILSIIPYFLLIGLIAALAGLIPGMYD